MDFRLCLALCLGAALLGAATAQTVADCSRSIPNCSKCRYQFYQGTTTKAICEACTIGYQVKLGGRACWCAPGYYRDDPVNNPDRCTKCGQNFFCPGAKANKASGEVHNECGLYKMTTTEFAKSDRECLAKPGYGWGPGDNSKECPLGFYNPGNNNRKCTKCPGGLTTAATKSFSTQNCGAPAGYYYLRGRAVACARGTYKAQFGNDDCSKCPEGFTTADGEVAKTAASDCKYVLPGYSAAASGITLGTTAATACAEGTYRAGDALYTAGTAVACSPCPAGMSTLVNVTGATSADSCLVKPGYGWKSGPSPGTAQICAIGSYNPGWNREVCTSCGQGTITTDAAGSANSDDCKVPAGHGNSRATDGVTLTGFPCPINTYGRPNATYGLVDVECSKCPDNTHTNGTASLNGDACNTNAGYGWYEGQVQACEFGYYNPGENKAKCKYCGYGMNTTGVASTSAAACQIAAGFTADGAGGLKPCVWGSYKDFLGAGNCTQCPSGTTTTLINGATQLSDCEACMPGYGASPATFNLSSPSCSACPSGAWAPGLIQGGADCTACPKPAGYTGLMVSRLASSTPEYCAQEFPTDASAGIENNQEYDIIAMPIAAKYLQLQLGVSTVAACQIGCAANAKCQYFEWRAFVSECYYKLADANITNPTPAGLDNSKTFALFEVAAGVYSCYLHDDATSVHQIGEDIKTVSGDISSAVAACNQLTACIGITHDDGDGASFRLFKGTKWEGYVGKVRAVGVTLNAWIGAGARPSSAAAAGSSGGPSNGWTSTPLIPNDYDDGSAGFALPRGVALYGQTYAAGSTAFVSTNGFLTFSPNTWADAYNNFRAQDLMPYSMDIFATVAPFWDDLVAGTIFWGVRSNDTLGPVMVQWTNMRAYGGTTLFTFQAFVYPNGDVGFVYKEIISGTDLDRAQGNSATAFINNADRSKFFEVAYQTTDLTPGNKILLTWDAAQASYSRRSWPEGPNVYLQ